MKASNTAPKKGALRRVIVVTAIVAGVALAAAAVTWLAGGGPGGRLAAGRAVDETASLPAAGATQLTIRTVSDDVRVAVTGGDSFEVRLHGVAAGSAPGSAPRLSAERKGSVVAVSVERDRVLAIGWSRLVLEVTVPRGWAGALDVGTVSAGVALPQLSAAAVSVHTVSGSLRAEALEARTVELTTVSGDLVVQRLVGSARVRSTSGDVRLTLPPDAGFRLDARSTSGRVSCAFPIQLAAGQGTGQGRSLAGTVGDGRDEIVITTVSGSIALAR